jgi:hypothetical protein
MRCLRRLIIFPLVLGALWSAGPALAGGGNYAFAGGTPRQQAQVRAALDASAFDWNLVPVQVTIHIAPGIDSEATAGDIWLDANLLNTGRFSWGVVEHEYAHQVDFFLLDETKRAFLKQALGGKDWCYGVPGLQHAQYGCERFASTLAWAYWPSSNNSMKPNSAKDESAAMAPAKFRALLATLIGAPNTVPENATAFAPKRPKTK